MSEQYTPITLEDFAVSPVTLKLHTQYGRTLNVRLVPLTYAKWAEIGADVESPREPAQKNPSTMAVWKKHTIAAEEERNCRRVACALELGGNEIAGGTLEEKAKNLREASDRGLIMSIYRFLFDAAEGDKAVVMTTADTFLGSNDGDTSDVREARLDA